MTLGRKPRIKSPSGTDLGNLISASIFVCAWRLQLPWAGKITVNIYSLSETRETMFQWGEPMIGPARLVASNNERMLWSRLC